MSCRGWEYADRSKQITDFREQIVDRLSLGIRSLRCTIFEN